MKNKPGFKELGGRVEFLHFASPGDQYVVKLLALTDPPEGTASSEQIWKCCDVDGGVHFIPSNYQLDQKLEDAEEGAWVLIEYLRTVKTKTGRHVKSFAVHVANEDTAAELDARAVPHAEAR